MKRLANYLIATALLAFTLTSCEDVPSPFGEVVPPPSPETDVIDPAGSGTEKDPYNVAGVLEFISGLGADTPSEKEVYIKGYAVELTDISAQYGNATFTMSDDVDGKANKFTVYRAAGLGNQKVTDANFIKQGDVVVVCGKVTNFKGNTPETVQGSAYVYSVNGETGGGGGDTPSGDDIGSKDAPLSCAQALEKIKALADGAESDGNAYVKGKVVKVTTNQENFDKYGNLNYLISDDGTETNAITVYSGDGLNGDKFKSISDLAPGDEVIVYGKLYKYVNKNGQMTPEINKGNYLVSLVKGSGGGGGDTPSGEAKGTGTEADPFNVAAAIAKCLETGQTATTDKYYIKGIADADYTVNSYKNIEVDIVDVTGSADKFKVFRCKAADNKDIKEGFKVKKGDVIIVYGPVINYKGNTPETATGAYVVSINGQAPELEGEGGGEQGGGEQGGGSSSASSLTNGDFESWTSDSQPTGWKSASTASSATLAKSTDAHGGSFSCNVKGGGTQNKRLACQEITLEAGSYTFAFWVKATSSNKAQVRPGYVPVTDSGVGSYAYGDYVDISTSWSQVKHEFTLDAKTTVCLVVMNPKSGSYSSGEDVLIDDATLTKK